MKRLLLIVLPLLLIVGCSQKPVEDSTLINKDGLMYLPDSDSPYSGEVFTNYSTGEKLYQGTYENGLLVQYSYLNKDGSVKEPVNMETLIDRGGNLFEINGQKPYTGEVFELYDNGNRKLSGKLKGGKKDGVWITWYENGKKEFEKNYKDGKDDELWTYWDKNDGKMYKGKFNNNKNIDRSSLNGSYFGYDREHLIHGSFKDGEKDGLLTVWSPNGQKKEETTNKDGKRDGLHTEWYENGQKKSEETYKDGKEDGLGTYFSENGQKGSEVTYKDGKKDGLITNWYENGQKRYEGTFKDGEYISSKCWDEDGNECYCEYYYEGCK